MEAPAGIISHQNLVPPSKYPPVEAVLIIMPQLILMFRMPKKERTASENMAAVTVNII